MSPRAACRLESLGFRQVYDYVLGIADWRAAGLPVEGHSPPAQRVADATRPDIPTCAIDEDLEEVRRRTFDAGWDECIVVDDEGIVVGRLRGQAWAAEDATAIEQVMESGPTTVRPDALLQPLVKRMAKRGTRLVTVTTPQGVLIGVLLGEDAERLVAGEPPQQIWRDCEGCPGTWALKPSDDELSQATNA